jgi:DNA end-binding protein Ku
MWSGAISVELVNIPVRLYDAVHDNSLHFHMLHTDDGGRIRMKRVCSVDGSEVPYEAIAKGFEIEKGRLVKIDPGEIEKLAPHLTHTIEIREFVDLTDIDPIYFDGSYYVAPDNSAVHAYALLQHAMNLTGKVALGRIVLRTKEHLCALRPVGKVLVLSTMRHADEVLKPDDIGLLAPVAEAPARESEMAKQLIETLSGPFRPEELKDEYRERVADLIQRKASGEEIVVQPEARGAEVLSLVDALSKSLERQRGAKKPVPQAPPDDSHRRVNTRHRKPVTHRVRH